ncbi:hypothetical protein FA13DRAFT_1841389 [Coprinellus micaceus]|uniref:Uncharacterized protein n=1 Tax=Coprinellus micaceus TaxID=71717 RepID=A0A4Y7TDL2_COPMI|nr:hypothetical protein FA13DRAFT_1841389 [Coprinellus micaceus]
MSKRKNAENVFHGSLPEAKRIRSAHPLEDSAIINSAPSIGAADSILSSPKSKGSIEPNSSSSTPAPTVVSTSAIAGVPPEIILKTFEIVTQDTYTLRYGEWNVARIPDFSANRAARFAFSAACKAWSAIAASVRTAVDVVTTHSIWNDAVGNGTFENIATEVHAYVEGRGLKNKPILLQVGPLGRGILDGETESLPARFIPSLLDGLNITSLILTSINATAIARVRPSGLLPNMTSLVLKLHSDDFLDLYLSGKKITIFKDAERLTHATILNAVLPYEEDPTAARQNLLELPFSTITHYLENHRDFDTESIPSVLYNVDQLANLQFLWIRMPNDIAQDVLPTLGPYILPNLQSLALDATPLNSITGVPGIAFLSRLRVERLKRLALIGGSLNFSDLGWSQTDAEGTQFLAILSAFHDLESLSLSYPRIPKDSLRKTFLAAKNITSLDIHITRSKKDCKVVFDAITIHEGEVDPLLPNLERLSFDVANQREPFPALMIPSFTRDDLSDPDLLAAFIKSRRGSGLPEGVVPIQEVVMFTDWDEQKEKKWEVNLGDNKDVLTYRHLAGTDYTHLRHGFQRDRVLERTRCLDGAYEAKQFYSCGPLYWDV